MSELRWILLAAGLAMIAGVYLWGTRSRQRTPAATADRPARFEPSAPVAAPASPSMGDGTRFEPRISASEGVDSVEPEIDFDEPPAMRTNAVPRREPTLGPPVEPPQRPRQKIVTVRVLGVAPERLSGTQLLEAFESEGLEYGRYEIFHRLHDDGRPLFSVASLREPGTFDPAAMATTSYPGIALFGVVPGPLPAVEMFDQMIFTARALSSLLGASLGDDRGAPLTVQRITRLREEMLAFEQQRPGGVAD